MATKGLVPLFFFSSPDLDSLSIFREPRSSIIDILNHTLATGHAPILLRCAFVLVNFLHRTLLCAFSDRTFKNYKTWTKVFKIIPCEKKIARFTRKQSLLHYKHTASSKINELKYFCFGSSHPWGKIDYRRWYKSTTKIFFQVSIPARRIPQSNNISELVKQK